MPIFLPGTILNQTVAGNSNFKVVTYTGNASTNAITGVGFQPSMVLLKSVGASGEWGIFDSLRGANQRQRTTGSHAEDTVANSFTSFDSDGFTLGSDTTYNANAATYIAFCWKTGSAQYDQQTFTGNGSNTRQVSHSLGVAPGFVMDRVASNAYQFPTWGPGSTVTTGYFTTGTSNPSMYQGAASNTTTTFNPAVSAYDNESPKACYAWLFGTLASYSQIGHYTGNGSATGPTVSTGFAPSLVVIKLVGTGDFFFIAKARNGSNPAVNSLALGTTAAESAAQVSVDLNATSFQIKSATLLNTNTSSYFYMAFA